MRFPKKLILLHFTLEKAFYQDQLPLLKTWQYKQTFNKELTRYYRPSVGFIWGFDLLFKKAMLRFSYQYDQTYLTLQLPNRINKNKNKISTLASFFPNHHRLMVGIFMNCSGTIKNTHSREEKTNKGVSTCPRTVWCKPPAPQI